MVNEIFINKLSEVLEQLKNAGIQGVRELEFIQNDLKFQWVKEISVLRNDQFELVFIISTNEILLKTTYSNQVINDDFIKQMNTINACKGAVLAPLQVLVGGKLK